MSSLYVDGYAPARWVFNTMICGSRRKGRLCMRWKDQIKEALSTIGVTNWSLEQEAKDVLKQAVIR